MKTLIPLVAQAIEEDETLRQYVRSVQRNAAGLLDPESKFPAVVVSPADEEMAVHSLDETSEPRRVTVFVYLDEPRPDAALEGKGKRPGLLDAAQDLKTLFRLNQLGEGNREFLGLRVEYPQLGQMSYPDLYEVRVHLSYREIET